MRCFGCVVQEEEDAREDAEADVVLDSVYQQTIDESDGFAREVEALHFGIWGGNLLDGRGKETEGFGVVL